MELFRSLVNLIEHTYKSIYRVPKFHKILANRITEFELA